MAYDDYRTFKEFFKLDHPTRSPSKNYIKENNASRSTVYVDLKKVRAGALLEGPKFYG